MPGVSAIRGVTGKARRIFRRYVRDPGFRERLKQVQELVLSQPPNNNYPNRLAEGRSKAIGPTLRFQTLPIPRLTEY